MSNPHSRPNRAIPWFRFMLWLTPSVLVPVLIYLMEQLSAPSFFGIRYFLEGAIILAAVFGVGYFDSKLKWQQKQISQLADRNRQVVHAVIFLLCQLLITPVVLITVAWGACMLLYKA